MLIRSCSFALMAVASQVVCGLSPITTPCLRDSFKPYENLLHKVMLFREDNRKILETHFSEFGLQQKDVDQYRSAAGVIHCPRTLKRAAGGLNGDLFETKDTVVTNLHFLIDPKTNRVRDDLSTCRFRTQYEISAGLPGHEFELEDGKAGFDKAVSNKHLKVGELDENKDGKDWAILKLKTPVASATPFKLPSSPLIIHFCQRTPTNPCPKFIGISTFDTQISGVGKLPDGKSSVQSFDLYGITHAKPDSPSVLFTNNSALDGTSASLTFMTDKNGRLLRENGTLVPVAILTGSSPDKYNGREYSGDDGIGTTEIQLDGPLADGIKEMAGQRTLY